MGQLVFAIIILILGALLLQNTEHFLALGVWLMIWANDMGQDYLKQRRKPHG